MDDRTLHNELVHMQRNLSHSMTDYANATRRMIYMVRAVDLTFEPLYSGPPLDRAIWRYEALWLPLLAAVSNPPPSSESRKGQKQESSQSPKSPERSRSKPAFQPVWRIQSFATKVDDIRSKNFSRGGLWLDGESVVPPIDIAWVWYVHRLNPHAYEEDLAQFTVEGDQNSLEYMRKACATTIDTAFRFSDGEDVQSKRTRRLWSIIYPFEPYMPKYLLSHSFAAEASRRRQQITSYANELSRASFRTVLKYDIRKAASLQKSFVYQTVSDDDDPEKSELFETNDYLYRAYDRYLQFIALHQHAPQTFLVPMNDINIIWHMHLSCTTEYKHDCVALVGYVIKHDTIDVEDRRLESIADMDAQRAIKGQEDEAPATLSDEEYAKIIEKHRSGIAIKGTKERWEYIYGSNPRYDLPDTRYRGQPHGDRGGYFTLFEKMNGTTKDISWSETVFRMFVALVVFLFGVFVFCWGFYRTMFTHGKYLLGLPLGVGIMGAGVFIFFAIPISRPLSSESRYWLERAYRQTHDPLPPYLISSLKKKL